jgi:hypothetical protein
MGILNDAKDTLLKYGGIVVQKTELYTRIAKLNIEIQRLTIDVDKSKQAIGTLVLDRITNGDTTLKLSDASVKELADKVKDLQEQITLKQKKIESLKNEDAREKND